MQRKYATKMFQMLSSPERHYVSCVACINSYLLTWRKKSMDKIRGRNTTYKFSWSSTTDTKILNINSGIRYTFIDVFVFPPQHPKGSVIKRSITTLQKKRNLLVGRCHGGTSWTSHQLSAGDGEHDRGDATTLDSLTQESVRRLSSDK